MADPPPYPDTGTPGWVKVSGIIAAGLVLLIVIMVLTELITGQGPDGYMFGGHLPLPGGHTRL